MSALDFENTVELVRFTLDQGPIRVRQLLYRRLWKMRSKEGRFYEGIIKHADGLGLSSEEWFELLSRLPIRILRSELRLSRYLSWEQQATLPPVTG